MKGKRYSMFIPWKSLHWRGTMRRRKKKKKKASERERERSKTKFKSLIYFRKPLKGIMLPTSQIYSNIANNNVILAKFYPAIFLYNKTCIIRISGKVTTVRAMNQYKYIICILRSVLRTWEETMSFAVTSLKCSNLSLGTAYSLQNCHTEKLKQVWTAILLW